MRKRHIYLILSCLIILLTLVAVKKANRSQRPPEARLVDVFPEPIVSNRFAACVLRIGSKEIRFTRDTGDKKGPSWRIEAPPSPPADEGRLFSLLNKLDQAQGQLRDEDPARLSDYGITDAEGIHVILLSPEGSPFVHFIIGRKRYGATGNFLRLAGKSEVYIVNDDLFYEFGFGAEIGEEDLAPERWMNRRILDFHSEDVTAVSLKTKEDEPISLLKTSSGLWRFRDDYPFPIRKNSVESFLDDLKGLKAKTCTALNDSLPEAAWTLTLTMAEGKKLTLTSLGPEKESKGVLLRVDDRPYLYVVPEHALKRVVKTDAAFFHRNPFDVQEASLRELRIRDPGGRRWGILLRHTVVDDEDVWRDKYGRRYATEAVENLIRRLQTLTITGIASSPTASKKILDLTIVQQDAAVRKYVFFAPRTEPDGAECLPLRPPGDPHLYCTKPDVLKKIREAVTEVRKKILP